MRIGIVTPAPPGSIQGNRVTALRWARRLRELGHRVKVVQAYSGEGFDLLLGLHLRHSAEAAWKFRQKYPHRPLLMALTGTDIYGMQLDQEARALLRAAQGLIALQPLALKRLPGWARRKAHVIYQSAPALTRLPPARDRFDACMLSHLRKVKDPLLAARAVRELPAPSRIRILHAGEVREAGMEQMAKEEMSRNPRYRWLGALPSGRARQLLRRSRALILPSLAEGGANAVSEAIGAGVPVLATRIPGNTGLLGRDYAGYFRAGDAYQLGRLLWQLESRPEFLHRLERQIKRLAPQFNPRRERDAWRRVLSEVNPGRLK